MEWFASLRALLGLDAAVKKGIEGEEAVAAKLAEKGWFRVKGLCLRNLYLPVPEGTAEIDLLLPDPEGHLCNREQKLYRLDLRSGG